jgi:purine-binding chemotaxis protein CheW
VHFNVDGRAYAIDIHRLREIIYFREVTPIPMAPGFILGVIDLRGQIIPVISLKERLGLTITQMTQQASSSHKDGSSHILIIKMGPKMAGLLVDGVREVIRLASGSVHPPDQIFAEDQCKYLEGICHYKDQLILVLDLNRLFSGEELKSLEQL